MSGLRANNPMSEYLLKIQLIVTNAEFKNKVEAGKYETLESKMDGEMYVRAKNHTDIFESYTYSPKEIYKHLEQLGFPESRIFKLIENPNMIPFNVKDKLLINARQLYIDRYKERNKYYLNLYFGAASTTWTCTGHPTRS